jgi:sugar/nucleoside kinase (ribokinase family)
LSFFSHAFKTGKRSFLAYNLFMIELVPLEPVDYLVIGHLTEDLTPAGPRLGGTAAFSALTARSLGLRVGVVSALSETTSLKALEGVLVLKTPSPHSTTFENIYGENGRMQFLHHQAAPISIDSVPDIWRTASIIHLGPVAGELGADWSGSVAGYFSSSLIGITPQGWMRTWDDEGLVVHSKWALADAFLPQAGAVVVSREDVLGDDELIESMAHQTRVLVVTEGAAGSVLYWNGDRRRFRAPEVEEVDATGAGDIFAAAFFVRLYATRDPWAAARFATQLAARSVARPGLDAIPTQAEIQECLMEVF